MKQTIPEFISAMRSAETSRLWIANGRLLDQKSGLHVSSSKFQYIVDGLEQSSSDDSRSSSELESGYSGHEAIFLEIGSRTDHLMGAFIHNTNRGQSAGGLRLWTYRTLGDLFFDGLRLSRGMSRKNALAGIWWGGGKGIIARHSSDRNDYCNPEYRQNVYADYGDFVSSISGAYVTAEDVGTVPSDIEAVAGRTRHVTCIPSRMGGSGNPSDLTAQGVVVAMEAALNYRSMGDLTDKVIAMQGMGNVATFMIKHLLERGIKQIIACDIDRDVVEQGIALDPDRITAKVVTPDEMSILATPCDILAPNAVGGILSAKTISSIAAPIVCGAANNQLFFPKADAQALSDRGILYVPDFLCNRMGIVNCANEQYGHINNDPEVLKHLRKDTEHGVYRRCAAVFEAAASAGTTTDFEARRLADDLMRELHPIWPHRSEQIIRHLCQSDWVSCTP